MSKEDKLFGVCAPPNNFFGIYPHEVTSPVSLVTLSEATKGMIQAFFAVRQSQILFTPVPLTAHVLWIMDGSCTIHLALEEVVDVEQNNALIGVLPKSVKARPPKNGFKKLGHPTLILPLGEVDARLAGEIWYDPVRDPEGRKLWCLTNDSGRYGTRQGQLREHLEAASGIFESFGLYFTVDFVSPPD